MKAPTSAPETAQSQRERWSRQLKSVAGQPLRYCPEFPAIARRWEAWWRFESDRPMLVGSIPKRHDLRWDKAFDLLETPQEWLKLRRQQLEASHWLDATIPNIRVDLGPVVTGALLGAPLHFSRSENTAWQDPIIESWDTHRISAPDPQNRWLRVMLDVARATAADAVGNYLVMTPDLSGAIDIVANLRGSERLLTDLYDAPEAVKRGAERALAGWDLAFREFYDAVLGQGAGLFWWLYLWSDTPYVVPTCDFNFMIGKEQFVEFCMPTLVAQARRAGRCAFHLDGPGASKHAETLAAEPSINAVQYTVGAGAPPAITKLEMFRLLQSAKKPLLITCPWREIPPLRDALDPRGVAFVPEGLASPQEGDALWKRVAG